MPALQTTLLQPSTAGSTDLGSSRLCCNENSSPHAGISIAKITWKENQPQGIRGRKGAHRLKREDSIFVVHKGQEI